MNMNHLEAIQAVQKLHYLLRPADYGFAEICVIAPFVDLRSLQLLIDSDSMGFSLGAQNCYFESKGAFTGEISAPMLAKLGVRYVLVGHSERRTIFGEDDSIVAKKLKAVFESQMIPILCVGETEQEKQAGRSSEVLTRQVQIAIEAVPDELLKRIVIAYEPVWAIGTGLAATDVDASWGASHIRSVIRSLRSAAVSDSAHILYGGSVNAGNARSLIDSESVDGLLVGGASLDPEEFARIVQS